jgi:cytochrome c551/c552
MKTKIILTATILFVSLSVLATPPTEEGKTIFTARCAACHNVHKIIVGPALAGVDQRRPIDWIVKFVHSSQSVVKSGDPYAVALYNKFNKIQMPDHPDLTPDNIKSVVEFIKAEAKSGTGSQPNQPGKTQTTATNYVSLVLTNKGLLIAAFALIALLITASLLAITVKQIQRSKTS